MADARQERLMEFLIHKNLEDFKELLNRKNKNGHPLVDVNHEYGYPYFMTCLAKAANMEDKSNFELYAEFVRELLSHGADPNKRSETHNMYAAIHFAVTKNNLPVLEALLETDKVNINLRNKQNQTPVYLAALHIHKGADCFEKLIFHPKTNIKIDTTKLTAIGKAVEKKCDLELLRKVIKHVKYLRKDDKEMVLKKFPDIDIDLSKIPDEDDDDEITPATLYRHLEMNKLEQFKSDLNLFINSADNREESKRKTTVELLNDDNLNMTLLQMASFKGYQDIVKTIIDIGVDLNATTENEKRPPIHLACYKGHYGILDLLYKNEAEFTIVNNLTVLHSIFKGLIPTKDDHKKCFDYVLQKNSKREFINHKDQYGHTALHYAILEKDDHFAKELMKYGAYIGERNTFGISPLHDMEPAVLEAALNNCIVREESKKSQQYTLKVDFKILKPDNSSKSKQIQEKLSSSKTVQVNKICDSSKKDQNHETQTSNGESAPLKPRDVESGEQVVEQFSEMYPLYYISESKKLQHLLKHPVLLIFLHLKWKRIIMIFLLNIIFFTLFVIFFTADIFCRTCDSSGLQSNVCNPEAAVVVRTILYFLFAILIIREFFQLIILPDKLNYFKNLENVLELGICITTILILLGICSKFLTAITLILSWTELILQFGCIQRLAVYNEMLKRVTWNYLKFLLWYFPLILAFTFSFYKLYHVEESSKSQDAKNEQENTSTNSSTGEEESGADFYSDFSLSFLKTVVMMIGEYDASDMKFTHGGKVVFLFFVFMITIVLLNLLNGVAVSDTQAIRDEAELVILKFRVKLVYHFESVLFENSLGILSEYLPWRKTMMKKVTLFPDAFPGDCLRRQLTVNTKIGRYLSRKEWKGEESEHRPDECFSFGKWRFGFYIDRAIFDAAKEIADRRDAIDETSDFQLLQQQVEDVKSDVSEIKKLLDELMDKRQPLTI